MAFKSEIHVAELASIRTGHTEGDIYYILDNGMLGDLPCKPGNFVEWHNNDWRIVAGERYALKSEVDDALEEIGKPLQWKGPATVAQLNAGITGIQEGWTYTLTDAGTLTDGNIDVEAGDEVAWTGTAWFKVGGDSAKLVVLQATYDAAHHTFNWPSYSSISDLVAMGKSVCIIQIPPETAPKNIWWLTGVGQSAQWNPYHTFIENDGHTLYIYNDNTVNVKYNLIKSTAIAPDYYGLTFPITVGTLCTRAGKFYYANQDIATSESWTPAHWTETDVAWFVNNYVRKSTRVFTGTYNPAASPADYSGMPNTYEISAALDEGADVVLLLTNPANSNVSAYRLTSNEQYVKRFIAISNDAMSAGWSYVPALLMTYGGPGNPWGWASPRYLSQELRTATVTESDITGGHCEVYNLNALTTMTLTSVNSVTIHTKDYSAVNNFAVQIDNTGNSNDVTIDVQHGPDSLKYSVAGGNTVGAGKYMQLTCVGSCWTLAEFTAPTP